MFISFEIVFKFNTKIDLNDLLIKVLAAALFEELFFRGFLFCQVFRYTTVGFIPSVFLGALFFLVYSFISKYRINTIFRNFCNYFFRRNFICMDICRMGLQYMDPHFTSPVYESCGVNVHRNRKCTWWYQWNDNKLSFFIETQF